MTPAFLQNFRWRDLLVLMLVAGAILVLAERACRAPLMAPGTAVPGFQVQAVGGGGEVVTRESLRGRRYVLFFWTAWCPHCKPMMPELERLAVNRPEARVVAVHCDPGVDPAAVTGAARAFPHLIVATGGERMLSAFGVDTFPSTYVIGADGRVCDGFVGRTDAAAVAVALERCTAAAPSP
jgi:thiol-disulfide isomerase/thioredoxin